jgi:hypothetical protein
VFEKPYDGWDGGVNRGCLLARQINSGNEKKKVRSQA